MPCFQDCKLKQTRKKLLKDLKEGKIDILIGTHRLLSKDVEFKNLQLLIIDDEQKFGVKQKEKLRQIKNQLGCFKLVGHANSPHNLFGAFFFKKYKLDANSANGQAGHKNRSFRIQRKNS